MEVVDSRTVGMALGMGVQSAVVAAADGRRGSRVRAFAEERLARTKVYFYVPSLEQLRRGGRIGAAASLLGTMLAIKPILAVDDGKIVPLEKVRSAAQGCGAAGGNRRRRCRGAAMPAGPASPSTTSATPAEAEEPGRRPGRRSPDVPPAQISSLPAVLAAHAGLGVLAVIVGES